MAILTDPDDLVDAASIIIDTAAKTVQLVVNGLLTTEGVTIKCVYSKLKELWRTNNTYIKFLFPMGPITDEQFEMINGWNWLDATTRLLLRTGGWAVKDTLGVSQEEWAGVITLGSLDAAEQVYYQQEDDGTTTNFNLLGTVNQAVQVYDAGVYDYRDHLNLYCRTYARTYDMATLSDIGVTTLSYQAYRFPLTTSVDTKITHNDVTVSGTAPYSGMSIWWGNHTVNIGGTLVSFSITIEGQGGTAEEIYEFSQYKLRWDSNIDASGGTHIGKITSPFLRFTGDTLYTLAVDASGTCISGYLSADTNRLVFTDDSGVEWTFPYTAVLGVTFGENLTNDISGTYWIYFTSVPSGQYGTSSGVIVNDASNLPMSGIVNGATSLSLSFAYDSNNQGGRTPSGNAPITAVAIGLSGSQFVKASGVITRSTGNSISLIAPLERNYSN